MDWLRSEWLYRVLVFLVIFVSLQRDSQTCEQLREAYHPLAAICGIAHR